MSNADYKDKPDPIQRAIEDAWQRGFDAGLAEAKRSRAAKKARKLAARKTEGGSLPRPAKRPWWEDRSEPITFGAPPGDSNDEIYAARARDFLKGCGF